MRARRPPKRPRPPAAANAVELRIERLGAHGDGIARHGERRVFVPLALPGELVRATIEAETAEGSRARLLDIIEASPARIEPPCPHFGACGGCTLQHLDDASYAAFKTARITDALRQRGIDDAPLEPLVRVAPGSRRRVRLAAGRQGRTVALGFRAARGRVIVDLNACPIMRPAIEATLPALRAGLIDVLDDRAEVEIGITEAANGLDVLLFGLDAGSAERQARLADLARALGLARLSVRTDARRPAEPVMVQAQPIVRFAEIPVDLPPDCFIQPTAAGEAAMTAALLDAASGAKRAADLYCGLGTFSLPLVSVGLRVDAYDSAGEAVAALDAAARRAGLADRLNAARRDLAWTPLEAAALSGHDLVAFDPPRAGAARQAAEIAASRVPTVAAASCNPASFARDARLLIDGGYRLKRLIPLDQFLWSPHIELMATFMR